MFRKIPENFFSKALELGAGDGFQSVLLARYTEHLTSTDINEQYIRKQSSEKVSYGYCDADTIRKSDFYLHRQHSFDLIFSSNLLEHLRFPEKALTDMRELLADDGIMIHIMPNAFWKLASIFLYHIHILYSVYERVVSLIKFPHHPFRWEKVAETEFSNNPHRKKKNVWKKLFMPEPHGEYPSNRSELWMYRKTRWIRVFENAGWRILAVRSGVVSSGYGFGWERLRSFFSAIHCPSEYIYILCKKESTHTEEKYKELF